MSRLGLAAALAALSLGAPVEAQSLWLVPEGRRTLLLEILSPSFTGSALEFPSAAAYLTGRFALSERLALQVELPVAYANLAPVLADLTQTGIGSPYVGLVARSRTSALWGEVGARLPVASDNTTVIVGAFADLERVAAWASEVLPVTALAGYRWSYRSGLFVAVRAGPELWLDVGDADNEAVLHAAFQTGFTSARFGFAAALTSLTVITGGGDLGDRSAIQAGLLMEARVGALRPGATLFVPVDDDLRDVIDAVFGLRLGVVLP